MVIVKLELLGPEEEESAVEYEEHATGQRRLEVTIVRGWHLPKMDTIGTVDAFSDVGRSLDQEEHVQPGLEGEVCI